MVLWFDTWIVGVWDPRAVVKRFFMLAAAIGPDCRNAVEKQARGCLICIEHLLHEGCNRQWCVFSVVAGSDRL